MRHAFLRTFCIAGAILVASCGGSDGSSNAGGGDGPTTTVTNAPVITTQPRPASVASGTGLTLSVTASGTELTYQWYRDGFILAGATASSYTIGSVTPVATTGTYRVVVTNPAGSVSSRAADVSVGSTGTAPIITLQPASIASFYGVVSLSVVATGRDLVYQWFFNGLPLAGATGPSYTFQADPTTVGNYAVSIANAAGSVTSATAVVSLGTTAVPFAPTIVAQPLAVSATSGTGTTLTVTASGSTPTYQWFKDGSPIAGAVASSYAITVSDATAGTYLVVVSNAGGSVVSASARVMLGTTVAPAITTQPRAVTMPTSTPVSFTVVATGSDPVYQWFFNGFSISGATDANYAIANPLGSTVLRNDGQYTVVVTNGAGSVTSQAATLTLSGTGADRIGPLFTTQPLPVAAAANSTVTLVAGASGSGVTYQWYLNGATIVGATSATYVIASLSNANTGLYNVVASNAFGRVASQSVRVAIAP